MMMTKLHLLREFPLTGNKVYTKPIRERKYRKTTYFYKVHKFMTRENIRKESILIIPLRSNRKTWIFWTRGDYVDLVQFFGDFFPVILKKYTCIKNVKHHRKVENAPKEQDASELQNKKIHYTEENCSTCCNS